MEKELYISPTTTCRTLESSGMLLSASATVPDMGFTDEVKEQKFDFNDNAFSDNPWEY